MCGKKAKHKNKNEVQNEILFNIACVMVTLEVRQKVDAFFFRK